MDLDSFNLRKAALLITTLDRESADQLLDQLSPDRAQQVRDAIMSLTEVDEREQRSVIREFLRDEIEGSPAADRVIATLAGSKKPGSSAAGGAHAPGSREKVSTGGPLDRASERLIAECLSDELPQAIAVALAQLPTHRASEVVSHLPAAVQTQVLERLVELDPSNSWELPEIRAEFQLWLDQQIERSLNRAELASRLATILEATHSGTRERILHNVLQSDARLAKELQHQLNGLPEPLEA
jgi:flagellar motor switch protein FliG